MKTGAGASAPGTPSSPCSKGRIPISSAKKVMNKKATPARKEVGKHPPSETLEKKGKKKRPY